MIDKHKLELKGAKISIMRLRERERRERVYRVYIRSHKAHIFGAPKAMNNNYSVIGLNLGDPSLPISQESAITEPNPR